MSLWKRLFPPHAHEWVKQKDGCILLERCLGCQSERNSAGAHDWRVMARCKDFGRDPITDIYYSLADMECRKCHKLTVKKIWEDQ